ncbi:MAG: serine/threonine protein phosphatase, partial [Bacteroidaceae bacterium]|nr:serine/threonine protein phosphatase [Bacteroidaceae bacterium]
MRKTILTALAFTAVLGGQAQHRADQQQLDNPESFSMIVLGDPQGYMKYDINQPLFELCTAWIADNVDHLNIKSVLCTGDLVETNECITR